MPKYYNPGRTKNLYDPHSDRPFRLSRSKLDLFITCPLCFYLDKRLVIAQPPGYPFTLNTVVDNLWKSISGSSGKTGLPYLAWVFSSTAMPIPAK